MVESAAMSTEAIATPRAVPSVVAGAVVGMTWATALRGWTVQMAGKSEFYCRLKSTWASHYVAPPRQSPERRSR
jgi:hypothetical protein